MGEAEALRGNVLYLRSQSKLQQGQGPQRGSWVPSLTANGLSLSPRVQAGYTAGMQLLRGQALTLSLIVLLPPAEEGGIVGQMHNAS